MINDELNHNNIGVLYIAIGDLYLSMALLSMQSLKKICNLPVTIITNIDFKYDDLDFWTEMDNISIVNFSEAQNRIVKLSMYELSTYKRTLFLDCDTYIIKDISLIFRYLDYFDIALRLNSFGRFVGPGSIESVLDGAFRISDLPHWNSGVVAFKKSENSKNFFEEWKTKFELSNLSIDQISLVDTLFSSNVRFLSLGMDWNYHPKLRYYMSRIDSIKVLHYLDNIPPALAERVLELASLEGINLYKVKSGLIDRRKTFNKRESNIAWIYNIVQLITKRKFN
jgi:hypothetical protein